MSSSAADAASITTTVVCVLPASSSRSGVTTVVWGPFENFAVICRLKFAIASLACSIVTPGFSLATTCALCQPKFVRIHGGNDAGIQMSMSGAGQEEELLRHHADHFVRVVVHGERAAQNIRRPAEAALPQTVADEEHANALVVLLGREHATDSRAHAQHAPEIGRGLARPDLVGRTVAGQRRVLRLRRRDVAEDRVAAPPLQHFRGGGEVLRNAVAAQIVPDHDELVRGGVRQRTEQDGVEGAEHRGHAADAERQRGDGHGREPQIAADLAEAETDIARELLETRPAPRRADVFFHERRVAERPPRAPRSRFLRLEVEATLNLAFEVRLPRSPLSFQKPICQPSDRAVTRPMAPTSRCHFDSSTASCFRPAALSR